MAVSDIAPDSCWRCIATIKLNDTVASRIPFADIGDGRDEFGTIVDFSADAQVCCAAAGPGAYVNHEIILILFGQVNSEDLRCDLLGSVTPDDFALVYDLPTCSNQLSI